MKAVTRRCDLDDCPTRYDFQRNRWRLCRRATNCEFADFYPDSSMSRNNTKLESDKTMSDKRINQTKKQHKIHEDKRLTFRVPPHLYQMIADTAEMEGMSVNWWLVKTLDAVFLNVRQIRHGDHFHHEWKDEGQSGIPV